MSPPCCRCCSCGCCSLQCCLLLIIILLLLLLLLLSLTYVVHQLGCPCLGPLPVHTPPECTQLQVGLSNALQDTRTGVTTGCERV